MEIKYKFVNGEKASIDVSGDFEKIILELDRNLYNNNHTETRRHMSLNALKKEDKTMLKDMGLDLEDQVLNRADSKTLYKAISKLKPDEQELIHNLYLGDHPITQKEYAKNNNLSVRSVKMRVQRVKSKIKELLYKGNK